MAYLVPCVACGRHVRSNEAACPFCGGEIAKPKAAPRLPTSRLGRAALFAFGATVVAAAGCGDDDSGDDDDDMVDSSMPDTGRDTGRDGNTPDSDADTPEDAMPDVTEDQNVQPPYGAPPDEDGGPAPAYGAAPPDGSA